MTDSDKTTQETHPHKGAKVTRSFEMTKGKMETGVI